MCLFKIINKFNFLNCSSLKKSGEMWQEAYEELLQAI